MNKTPLTVSVLAAICFVSIPLASADTIFGLYAGGGNWNTNYSGDIGTDGIDVEDDLSLDEAGRNFFYIAIEHPIPFLPNIKLQRTDIKTDGDGTLTAPSSQFDQLSFLAGDVFTEVDLSHTDITFYYEILDNWVNLDLGITARMFDGDAKITGSVANTLTAVTENIDIDGASPMLYAKAQFKLPFTGLSIGGDVNAMGFGGSSLIDYSVNAAYMSNIVPLLEIGLELGYRSMQLQLDDVGDLESDFTIDGPYISVILHF